jgi:hypothetical protein
MSKLQTIQLHAVYLRQLEQHLAVATGRRRDDLQTKIKSAQSKLQIILRRTQV